MDTPKQAQPPVMRPLQFGEASSHVTHRPNFVTNAKGKLGKLMLGRGIGKTKVL